MDLSTAELAKYIDHTLLKPQARREDILALCREAAQAQVMSVCVNPVWVSTVHTALKDTGVLTCSVVSFPPSMRTRSMKYSSSSSCGSRVAVRPPSMPGLRCV